MKKFDLPPISGTEPPNHTRDFEDGFNAGSHGGLWNECELKGRRSSAWFRGYDAAKRQFADASTMEDWRRLNPNPTHGCGHMQGRGAA